MYEKHINKYKSQVEKKIICSAAINMQYCVCQSNSANDINCSNTKVIA